MPIWGGSPHQPNGNYLSETPSARGGFYTFKFENMNLVILLGNLGSDPEIHRLESGVVKASFSLATTEKFKDKSGETKSNTEWHKIVLWRGIAEVAEKYLKKGAKVSITGKITYRSYEDKEGQKKFITEIIGDKLEMLGRPTEARDLLEDEETEAMNSEPGYSRGQAAPAPTHRIPPQDPPNLGDDGDGLPF